MKAIPFPPTHMMFDGPQDEAIFKANGEEFLRIYCDLCGLMPTESILDVGSGIGRKTIPLTYYLDPTGSYDGIDVTESGVKWCQENITSVCPNFRFQHIDVHAPGYFPEGTCKPENYRFPFDDGTFDFVVMGSVFTHMQVNGIDNYLRETMRVLKIDGRCLITYFLLDQEALIRVGQDPGYRGFPYRHNAGLMASQEMPEQAIAFHEDLITTLYRHAGLDIERIEHGHWSGRPRLSYQDIIVARKP